MLAERLPEVEENADTNAGVGHVKRRINVGAEMQVDKIDHMAVAQAVEKVADNAAAE